MDKIALAKEIGQLEGKLSTLEVDARKAEEKLSRAKRSRGSGAAALLTGILALILVHYSYLWILWAFLCIIGTLTLITAIAKQVGTSKNRDAIQADITATRSKLAEQRAMLMVG